MNRSQVTMSILLFVLVDLFAARFNLFPYFFVLGFILWLYILQSEYNKHSKFAWFFIIIINPLVGMIIYNMIGRNYQTNAVKNAVEAKQIENADQYEEYSDLFKILSKLGKSKIHENTELKLLENGEQKFKNLIHDLKQAKHTIYIEYYIIENSDIYAIISDILIEKARAGLTIKILIDAVGSSKFPRSEIARLKSENIEFAMFGKVRIPILNNSINFRNHRKIIVIDELVGFCGGINIADRYIEGTEKFENWHDLHIRVEGDLIIELLNSFANDWYASTSKKLTVKSKDHNIKNDYHNQVVISGPDNKNIALRNLYFKLLTTAKKRIVITTPYFICDDELLLALTTASDAGVEVTIILPGIPEGFLVGKFTRMNYKLLLDSNINIYETTNSFIHAKSILIDDELIGVGSVNFDYRSFFLNYEITLFTDNQNTIANLNEQLNYYIENSVKINHNNYRNNVVTRVTDSLIKPFGTLF